MNHIQKAIKQSNKTWAALARPLDTYDSERRIYASEKEAMDAYGDDCEFDIVHWRPERIEREMRRHNRAVKRWRDQVDRWHQEHIQEG